MRLRISKRDKNNDLPVTEERLPDRTGKLRAVEKQILESLYNDYPNVYDQFNWFPESNIVDVFKGILTRRDITTTSTLVLGRPGWGKTESMDTLAKDLGCTYHTIMLSHLQPEDIAGIPRIKNINSGTDLSSIPYDWERLPNNEKSDIKEIVRSSPSVTFSPQDWMKKTFEDAIEGKKTIWFFDEINTAKEATITAAFEVIRAKVISGTNNISLKNYVYVIAAGNFSSDNDEVKILSQPAMDRFPNKIAIAEDWNSGLKAAYKSWSDKNSGLDATIVAIVDTIIKDPTFKKLIETNNDLVASAQMGGTKLVGREFVISPRWLTTVVIGGIYEAAKAYYYSPSKDPAIISDIFEGVGSNIGYNLPNALLEYFMKKIPNVSAPTANGTAVGNLLERIDEASDMAEKWVKGQSIPKNVSPNGIRRLLGVSSADVETDIESTIAALKTLPDFKEITHEGWDAVANKIRPLLQDTAGPPENAGRIGVK